MGTAPALRDLLPRRAPCIHPLRQAGLCKTAARLAKPSLGKTLLGLCSPFSSHPALRATMSVPPSSPLQPICQPPCSRQVQPASARTDGWPNSAKKNPNPFYLTSHSLSADTRVCIDPRRERTLVVGKVSTQNCGRGRQAGRQAGVWWGLGASRDLGEVQGAEGGQASGDNVAKPEDS